MMDDATIIDAVRRDAVPVDLETAAQRLLEAIAPNVSMVLIGEATHGTQEFYRIRADLTRALVRQRGFDIVAVEADWPDAYRANQWVQLRGSDHTAEDALADFTRFPRWMWRNREVVRFLRWLRSENAERRADARVGFYGLDLYSLHRSMARVIEYLDKVDPAAAKRARQGYACFDVFGEDVQLYGYAASLNIERSCEDEVIEQLVDLRRRAAEYATRDGRIAADEYFVAEQNARVVRHAETYYRAMFRGGAESWNVRDRHMMETLNRLMDFHGPGAKGIVWAHNTHVGDARYTDMSRAGMLNIGQLAREQHLNEGVVLAGFGSHHGSVIAGKSWGAPMERMKVPEARKGSWEDVLHQAGGDQLVLFDQDNISDEIKKPRGHRAIGVVYQAESESYGNYVPTILPKRYDAFLYIDETEALHPLHIEPEELKPTDTYPWGV